MPQFNHNLKEEILELVDESKKLGSKGKNIQALSLLNKVSTFRNSKHLVVSIPLTCQISSLCNKIVLTVPSKIPYLKRAEKTLLSWYAMAQSNKYPIHEKIFRLILLTYNNWAAFHQSSRNYHVALSYLMKGLRFIDEVNITEADSFKYVAITKLNVGFVYTELNRYSDAIDYAEKSLNTLQSEYKLRLSGIAITDLEGKSRKKSEDMITTYIIAFYNIGVANEALNKKLDTKEAFKNAVNIGNKYLDPSNSVLLTAKKALKDTTQCQIRSHSPKQIHTSLKISPEMMLDVCKPKPIKLQLSASTSNAPLLKQRRSVLKSSDNGMGRYYSDAKLKKISEKIENDKKLQFISADQYFYKEISKLMNIGSDIKYLRPLSTSGAMTWWDKESGEKRKISDLRLKKQHRWSKDDYDQSLVCEKIGYMRACDDDYLKKQEIKIKSKMKTKVYKQLLRSISNNSKKYVFPPQSKA